MMFSAHKIFEGIDAGILTEDDLLLLVAGCGRVAIPELAAIHAAAWGRQNLKVQTAVMERLRELGVPRILHSLPRKDDPDQRDFEEEAAAHGVSVISLLRRG